MTLTPKNIRTDIVTRLTGQTSCGTRVYDSRMPPWQPGELPAITVYSGGHTDQSISLGSPVYRRTEQIVIELIHEGSADAALAGALDNDEQLVKEVLLMAPDWVSQFENVDRISVQRGRDIESDHRRMLSRITFEIEYVAAFEPVIADDFTKVELTVDEPALTTEVVATYTLTAP